MDLFLLMGLLAVAASLLYLHRRRRGMDELMREERQRDEKEPEGPWEESLSDYEKREGGEEEDDEVE